MWLARVVVPTQVVLGGSPLPLLGGFLRRGDGGWSEAPSALVVGGVSS